jgi:hypothetical protein
MRKRETIYNLANNCMSAKILMFCHDLFSAARSVCTKGKSWNLFTSCSGVAEVFICIIVQVHIYLDIYFALSEVAFLTSSFFGLRQIMSNVKIQ